MLHRGIKNRLPVHLVTPDISRRSVLAAFGGPQTVNEKRIIPWPAARRKHLEPLSAVVESGKYHRVNHPAVSKLEKRLSDWSGWWTARAVGSGTSALHIALDYHRRRGGKVVTAALNWPGAVGPIGFSDLTPEFVDIRLEDTAIDEDAAAERIAPDVGSVLITHLFGNHIDAPRLRAQGRLAGVALIDDVAQAIGTLKTADGELPLNSDVLALSGNGAKHLGAGELGFVLTRDAELIEHVDRVSLTSSARNGARIFSPETTGHNYRPNVFSAAIAASRLKRLDAQLSARRRNCFYLWGKIRHCEGLLPLFDPADTRNSFLGMALRIEPEKLDLPDHPVVRDTILDLLTAEGVPARIWLTKPVFEYLPRFRDSWSVTDFPNTRRVLDTMFYIAEIAPPNGKDLMREYADAFHKVWDALPELRQEIHRKALQ